MATPTDKRLFLLDGHALVYRAHFAFINRPLINSKGINTSAMMGFTRTLWDLMKNQHPTHLAVVFDPSGPTFRNDLAPDYKANREEQPEDITVAFPYIHQILQGFRIPVIVIDNFEADDVIGTLSKQAARQGYTVYMVTPDKDYGQLVEENILMYKPSRMGNGIDILGVDEIKEKWEIERPEQVIDLLGLMGDTVDNIPGVPGIGPKTAAKFIQEFGSLENLLDNLDRVKGKNQERLREFRDQAILSKVLATIDVNVPITFDAEAYLIEDFDREHLTDIFRELEFRSIANEILGEKEEAKAPVSQQGDLFAPSTSAAPASAPTEAPQFRQPAAHAIADFHIGNTEQDYRKADRPEDRAALVKALESQTIFAFDTETTGLDATTAELVGLSFSWAAGQAYYVPVPEDRAAAEAIVAEFAPVLANPAIKKVGQNIKYDLMMLERYGAPVSGPLLDTMVMHYLLHPDKRHAMDILSEEYLNYKPIPIENLIGKGAKQLSMRQVAIDRVVTYACEDADVTLRLYHALWPELEEEGLTELYETIEAPLIPVLKNIELAGVNLNVPFLENYSKQLAAEIQELEREIYQDAGSPFNIGSPKQIGEILFGRMGVAYKGSKTKTGQYKTDESTLLEVAADYPIVKKILRYRSLSKLLSTYVDALPLLVNPATGRIHSSFNQTIAATGRLSSANPNLQNIPVRTPQGAEIRKAFIPRDKDHILLASDYSQIELRLVAALSGDEGMVKAFQEGRDIHTATAALVFDIPFEQVDREQRNQAKTINFAILYGAGSQRLMQELEISRAEASNLIKSYYERFPGLKEFMQSSVEQAREEGYACTLLGRKRSLRDINSSSSLARSIAERMAMNTPIQGTAADMIKIAMIRIDETLRREGFKTRMILQVHDELVFDAPKSEADRVIPIIEELMREAIPDLAVPIVVETGRGENWLEAH
ncbi:DNA polymerase I [Neolewinella lacunae]|uniref:DNA polymerase I n=1 Tax=Neolewinella lacunae TaxID=1517758 RepID=A0A923PGE1_9BACT|nr:DNA polymerase I [Neolewinella lacunae]MBC6992789.1 DNA polymerase I [Neolewinella lacunae]MDN3636033.1 DNA polymerase I [Neolewinella lacunae]